MSSKTDWSLNFSFDWFKMLLKVLKLNFKFLAEKFLVYYKSWQKIKVEYIPNFFLNQIKR